MSMVMTIEAARSSLKDLLEGLHLGETVTVINAAGMPLAVLISLNPAPIRLSAAEWHTRWEALVHKVNAAWTGDQTALEALAEMRR